MHVQRAYVYELGYGPAQALNSLKILAHLTN